MKTPTNLGLLLLAIWLILYGVFSLSFLGIHFSHAGDVLAIFALAAGILLILKR